MAVRAWSSPDLRTLAGADTAGLSIWPPPALRYETRFTSMAQLSVFECGMNCKTCGTEIHFTLVAETLGTMKALCQASGAYR